jgi:S-formylglutathione hydrolase FrmB
VRILPALAALVLGATLPAPTARAQMQMQAQAGVGSVRTDTLWAQALGVKKALTVYLPPSYHRSTSRRYPVLYYLHGKTGNERNWVDAGALHRTMDSLIAAGAPEAIIAMPDGDDGWYTTWGVLPDMGPCERDTTRREPAATFCVPWTRYDDYITFDIVRWVDSHYRTRADRAHRGIAGLSMGGYGAITLALNYPTYFAAAASHSGVLSPRLLPDSAQKSRGVKYARDREEMALAARSLWPQLWTAFGHDSIAWRGRDPQVFAERLVTRVKAGKASWPALLIDVGTDDPWRGQNADFDATLTRLGMPHTYREWPGTHNWDYWRSHSPESLRFLLDRVAR